MHSVGWVELDAKLTHDGVVIAMHDDTLDRTTGYRAVRLPIAQYGESQTIDTKVACTRLLGQLSESRLGGLSVWTQPNSWHHLMSDHIVSFSVLPVSASSSWPPAPAARHRWWWA